MGDSGALPRFGEVDLELGDEPSLVRPPAPQGPAAPARREGVAAGSSPPPGRAFRDPSSRPTPRNIPALDEESTRIVKGDALSLATRQAARGDAPDSTRAWGEVDEQLVHVGEALDGEGAPSGRHPAPSGSGVATREGRIADIRDLYASGDADGALALAGTFGQGVAPLPTGDHPDASIVVEVGEQSIDLEDPFGDRAPPAPSASPLLGPRLTLTERQSLLRLLMPMGEVSKLKIDHRAGFLLAHVDGMHTLEEILDICAMPATEALGLISMLREMGVLELE